MKAPLPVAALALVVLAIVFGSTHAHANHATACAPLLGSPCVTVTAFFRDLSCSGPTCSVTGILAIRGESTLGFAVGSLNWGSGRITTECSIAVPTFPFCENGVQGKLTWDASEICHTFDVVSAAEIHPTPFDLPLISPTRVELRQEVRACSDGRLFIVPFPGP